MYLRSLKVENLKLLRDATIDFTRDGEPRMWTVLIGPNGTCKTSLLQAIGLATSGDDLSALVPNAASLRDLRQPDAAVRVEALFELGARFHSQRSYPGIERPVDPPQVICQLNMQPGHTRLKATSRYRDQPPLGVSAGAGVGSSDGVAGELVSNVRSMQLPYWFAAGYGVARNLPVPMFAKSMPDISTGRMKPLFESQPIIGTGFADIIANGALAEAYRTALAQVLVQGERLLPDVARFELAARNGVRRANELIESHRFDVEVGDGIVQVPAVWLSQGYQATIAWVADLIGQILWEAGTAIAPEDMEGLVLIDELDLHLHPSWQRVLIPALRASFPRIQFVATTHSPLLLTGLRDDEILRLVSDENGDVRVVPARESPALMTGSELYDHYFGITRPRYAADFQRYAYLAGKRERSDDEEVEVQALLARLHEAGFSPETSS